MKVVQIAKASGKRKVNGIRKPARTRAWLNDPVVERRMKILKTCPA